MRFEDLPPKILVWDTETTGLSFDNDRILTCYAMVQDREGVTRQDWHWTINPGVEVPEEASNVHGMTTEWVKEHGDPNAQRCIKEIYKVLFDHAKAGVPIVAYNLPYDLTMLDREVRRYGHPHGVEAIAKLGVFLDPLVIDKEVDKYRKGSRKLVDTARHYGIPVDETKAHDASYDVKLTGLVLWRILSGLQVGFAQVATSSIHWKRRQAASFQSYLRDKRGETGAVVDGSFPYRKPTEIKKGN